MKSKKQKFLKLPEFPGGKDELKKYIRDNLQYPELAKQNGIEGIVHLSAEIDDNGNVLKILIYKGLGYGCDEEAIRLISNIRFGSVKNRGRRVKITRKFRIEFKLPPRLPIRYELKSDFVEKDAKNKKDKENKEEKGYTYTIQF